MRSEEFVNSVDELVARQIARQTSWSIPQRNLDAETAIYEAIKCSLEIARKEIARPRQGTMTFPEAMDAIAAGKKVTRAGWGILRTLAREFDDKAVQHYRLDNLDGTLTGTSADYVASNDDRAATDWMIYQPPEEEFWVPFSR
jgi:hypothetical protein